MLREAECQRRSGLFSVRPEDPIPNGQAKSEIAVRFRFSNRMMNTVHVGRDKESSQSPIKFGRQADIAMGEDRGCVQDNLKNQDSQNGRPERQNNEGFPEQADGDFDRVKANRRCGVQITVRVVDAVQSPEPRGVMKGHMLRPDGEVEQDDCKEPFNP